MQSVYPSKIDATSAAPLIIAVLGALVACSVIAGSAIPVKSLIVEFIFLLLIGFPAWVFTTTNYTFDSSDLVIRSGPFSWRIPLGEINSVEPTNSPRSSPALSMDRLRIDYGKGASIMISPKDKEAFLRELDVRRIAGIR